MQENDNPYNDNPYNDNPYNDNPYNDGAMSQPNVPYGGQVASQPPMGQMPQQPVDPAFQPHFNQMPQQQQAGQMPQQPVGPTSQPPMGMASQPRWVWSPSIRSDLGRSVLGWPLSR
ncbi:hypothetical protein OZX74_08715 [Bifidobacterium sp. ESL0798]|uniref:hypothetical protein n=1 Tax=Bifidobacterium sp. ESL0798 TaxID=2983235 RepID=UPI0023F83075|nr:hypothetical protein [Bifidobacterium sp. ESL0798]WEV73943.1 hypothetical protein OZX74_08715 [Bifidobacterium sp. ESL0798]